MPATLPNTFGRYRILKKLGEGGMGTVYLAHDSEMDRDVALKVPQFDKREQENVIEQFKREARIASRIQHPGICPIYDVGCIDGIHYLTMAFIEGTEVADVLSDGKPWPPTKAIELTIRLAEALHDLHQAGIVHRDLKPGNILLRANGQPVLLDFGLARSIAAQSQALATKSAGQGTPAYMAPEQWKAKVEQIKPWTDVYALGLILFESLTGQRPFPGPSFIELFGQVTNAPRPRPSEFVQGVAPALDQLCVEVLAIDPQQRPGNMLQLIERLKQCQDDTPTISGCEDVVTRCPACGKRVRSTEKMSRKRIICPGCRAQIPPPGPLPEAIPLRDPLGKPSRVNENLGEVELTTETGLAETMPTRHLRHSQTTQIPHRPRVHPAFLGLALVVILIGVLGAFLLWPRNSLTTSKETRLASESSKRTTPTEPEPAKDKQPKDKPPPQEPEPTFTNSIGMKFTLIPAGKFQMGSSLTERAKVEQHFKDIGKKPDYKEYLDWEQPPHEVEITEAFYMGVYEVTQEEYEKVMKKNPSTFCKGGKYEKYVTGIDTKRFPVDTVSWNDAMTFIDTLNNLPEEKQKKRLYRLPTEAEWEYACRGGQSLQLFHYGEKLTHSEANFDTDYPFNSNDKKKALNLPVPVDDPKYNPNAFGLYHMHGNFWEWCGDYFDGEYYKQNKRQNPQGPQNPPDTKNPHRVLRGGAWYAYGALCRSASRGRYTPDVASGDISFRLVCVRTR